MTRRRSRFLNPFFFVLFLVPGGLKVQSEESYDDRKKRTFDFYTQNRFVDELPILEKLHAETPYDIGVLEGLSFATLANAYTIPDLLAQGGARQSPQIGRKSEGCR